MGRGGRFVLLGISTAHRTVLRRSGGRLPALFFCGGGIKVGTLIIFLAVVVAAMASQAWRVRRSGVHVKPPQQALASPTSSRLVVCRVAPPIAHALSVNAQSDPISGQDLPPDRAVLTAPSSAWAVSRLTSAMSDSASSAASGSSG